MRAHTRSRLFATLISMVSAMMIALPLAVSHPSMAQAATSAALQHHIMGCATTAKSGFCSEVYDSEKVFGDNVYIGHDEPSTLFYSDRPGSGNRMRYELTLPSDPKATPLTAGKSFNFQLHPAFFFGMAMCDTQSFPEQVSTCKADSDSNIVDPAVSAAHPGTAFMEMQFYPPGWVPWPAGNSCDATKWCAALNIDSLSQNPVTGQSLNPTCANQVGVEYVNFAFITKNGKPQPNSPPNPVNSTLATFTPDHNADLFMNSGDRIIVTLNDTAHGLKITLDDRTTHQSGSMTSSAANGFGQVQFDPTGTSCNNIPYDFHPMYSTSSEQTRVTWAAHSYNIAFSDEIGHFDYCDNVDTTNRTCIGNEGQGPNLEPADADDTGCHAASESLLVQVSGCLGTNTGFDGVPYQDAWPDGNTMLHPTAIRFTSPKTGYGFNTNYSRVAFEADLPRIEGNTCNRSTGVGCTLIPTTDDGTPAVFYPFFSTARVHGNCVWQEGNHIPGSINDFGQNAQYGTLLNLTYTSLNGALITRFNDFRQVISRNPCLSH
ncbi:MAG TPA: hypothetical protein VFV38_29840 [Ktedonobacteraceae bacterium]|nr:hypothetical protein [Ktedonobacteraceae bacterium]